MKRKKKKNLVLLPACSAIPCKNVYIHWTINKAYHIFSCLLRNLMANICFFTNVTTGLIFYLYLCVCAIYTDFFRHFFFLCIIFSISLIQQERDVSWVLHFKGPYSPSFLFMGEILRVKGIWTCMTHISLLIHIPCTWKYGISFPNDLKSISRA